jgi:hypothetical protein
MKGGNDCRGTNVSAALNCFGTSTVECVLTVQVDVVRAVNRLKDDDVFFRPCRSFIM